MHTWKLRETVLDLFERTTGGRVIFSVCRVGGLRHDVSEEDLALIVKKLGELVPEIEELAKVFIEDTSVKSRLQGVGVLTKEEAAALGAVGPVARGSGLRNDVRLEEKDQLYVDLGFEPCVETAGDSHARCVVRIRELFQSIELIKAAVAEIPTGDVYVAPAKGANPEREYIARVEQPRGEAFYYSKGAGAKFLERIRVRTPTNANIPAMVKTLAGSQLADVPMLILTIDPCISCTER
jgi:ech hydrogenase subunit E